MRFTFVILLFCGLGADAQMIIKAHANYRPYAVAAAQNLLLDDYPNAAAAYSLRKLDKDYTGNCMRIRRDSTGQTETDIGFDASGVVDTNAIKSFLRNNSGRVVRWYDQSGNGRDKINSTAATQPEIAFLGVIKRTNGKPCVNFQAGNVLTSASTYTITHHVMVARVVVQSVINYSYTNANTGFFWNGSFGGVNGLGGFDGTNVRSSTGEDLNQHLGWFSQRSGNLFVGRDGAAETNTGTFAASITIDRLGGRQNAAGIDFTGEVQEVVAWNSDQSSNRTGIENNINDYYNIYWNGDFAGLLDSFPSSAAAYSLRNLDKDYLGPLIRVRRSNDNAEQDIYGDYYGNLDTIGLKNFVGANSGFVTTWYDQSGNTRNATQTAAANQPQIVVSGVVQRTGTQPSILYNSTSQRLSFTAYNMTNEHLVVTVNDFSARGKEIIGRDAGGGRYMIYQDASFAYYSLLNGSDFIAFNATITINYQILQINRYTDGIFSRLFLYENTTLVGGIDENPTPIASASTINNLSGESTAFYFQGTQQEIIIYIGNHDDKRTGVRNNLNSYYGIY